MVWYYGLMNTILTMDKAGRLVLPKPIRDKFRLSAGDSLELESSDQEIVLRPVRPTVGMRKRDGIWVFDTGSPISAESMDETILKLREERTESILHPEGTKAGERGKSR
jgi:AbrB family looped-hinge helix DNA binding protein